MVKIVIVGGAIAGLTASQVLKEKLPSASVVLVSPSDKFYFNIPSPRILVQPELVDDAIRDIPTILKKRGQDYKQGLASGVDFDAKQVILDTEEKVDYDYVILATGSRTNSPAFKLQTSIDETKTALSEMSENIKNAKEVVIIGGGPTGVETAGEIAFTYPDKKVVLYTGGKQPLPTLDAKRGQATTSKLNALKIKVINNVFVDYEEKDGKYVVTEQGSDKTRTCDLVIPTTGLTPNTEYLDSKYLDKKGFVVIDDNLRVKNASNAYAFGDLVSGGRATVMDVIYAQKAVLAAVLENDVNQQSNKVKSYSPSNPNTMIVPISKQGGVGVAFGWGVPNFVVKKVKAADFMISKVDEYSE